MVKDKLEIDHLKMFNALSFEEIMDLPKLELAMKENENTYEIKACIKNKKRTKEILKRILPKKEQ